MKTRGTGRVAVFARKEEIQKLIEQGYPLIQIYEKYEDKLTIGYAQFVRYLNQYIRSKPDENEGKPEGIEGVECSLSTFGYWHGRYDAIKPKE